VTWRALSISPEVKGMFQKVNGTSGTNHVVTSVHGKFLSGTPRDKAKTTSAYVEFDTAGAYTRPLLSTT